MTKRMLIDATHPEETRVAVISGNKLEEYDFESIARKQLKSNIYLVKVTRVEPSLQAAFVDFGGNRHGFLAFPEIHPDYYRIPIADREALLNEERTLAEEQAAREDEEDAAELAAANESTEDKNITEDENIIEDEKITESETLQEKDSSSVEVPASTSTEEDENCVSKNTNSIAEEIGQEIIVDAPCEPVKKDDEEDSSPLKTDEDISQAQIVATGDDLQDKTKEDKAPDVEIIGGDVIDAPLYRSSIKRRYKIQEVIKRNQIMLIQISKEERGNKGAAVTTYISLPGRYCVLMPNSPRGGGVSRKVSNVKDRQRLKKILHELNVPEGMSVILRTAGVSRSAPEIKRDLDYLLRLWDQIREFTLKSSAPALIYEEGNLIKRAIRDLYKRNIDEVHISGEEAWKSANEFMRMLMPSHVDRIHLYNDETMPLFSRYQVENQIDSIHNPSVHMKSGGYIVINPTEALVSIDVNSGRATKGRHIEETALKTNLEAADEIARQLRLRDQGGLIVIDFIDMEDSRNNRIVERKMRDTMQHDRARIQLGRISAFGLMEISRQRLHPSLVETNFEVCEHCAGTGLVRTVETTGVIVLRAIEEEGLRLRAAEIKVSVPSEVALYIFNHKRKMLATIEKRHSFRVFLNANDELIKPNYIIEILRSTGSVRDDRQVQRIMPIQTVDISDLPEIDENEMNNVNDPTTNLSSEEKTEANDKKDSNNGRNSRKSSSSSRNKVGQQDDKDGDIRQRRRGRRGGRNRGKKRGGVSNGQQQTGQNNSQPIQIEQKKTSPQPESKVVQIVSNSQQEATQPRQERKGWWKRLTE
ncbi:MAG: ribonuclease E/G [Alphaproteobacteria bacterium]|nr:ribonuclease E/G [Alphaproteobacteria bacterium]